MSQDCFHQTLICLQKICVDNLKKKKKNLQFKLAATKMCACVCVCICVSYELTLSRRGMSRARVCVCVHGWLDSQPSAKHLYQPPIMHLCLSLSVSGCLSFVFFSLQSARFIYSFEFPDVCLCAAHTDFRHTHSV